MALIKLLTFLTLSTGFSMIAYASPKNITPLEETILSSADLNEIELSELEFKVTENIQINPNSNFDFYLLSQVYLLQLDREPSNMSKIHATSELAQHIINLDPKSELGYIVSAQVMQIMGYDQSAKQFVFESKDSKFKPSWRTYLFLAEAEPLASAEQREYLDLVQLSRVSSERISSLRVNILLHDENIKEALRVSETYHNSKALIKTLSKISDRSPKKAHKLYRKYSRNFKDNDFKLSFLELKVDMGKLTSLGAERAKQLKLKNDQEKRRLNQILASFYITKSPVLANQYYSRALKLSKDPIKEIYKIKSTYEQKGNMLDFISLLDKMKVIKPGVSEVYALQADLIGAYEDDLDKSIEVYSDAVLLDPYRSEYYTAIGLIYYKQKRYSKALGLFSKATSINPMDATAFYNKACMNSILGSKKRALDDLAIAFELDPSLKETAINDSDLKDIKNSRIFLD